MEQTWAIESRGLVKKFGSRVAVDEVTLRVPRGSVYGLVGPNGAGKTTYMRTVLGFVRSSGGEARVLGEPMPAHKRTAWPQVGVIIEEPRFYPFLSGRRNLLQVARLLGVGASRVDEALDQVGLGTRGDDPVKGYSLGMKQRLGIARALLPGPKLLVLDEPMNGLDPPGIREMRDLLSRFAESGGAVLISSHLLGELEQMCDHVALLAGGKLVADGPIEQFGGTKHVVRIHASDASRASSMLESAPGSEGIEVRAGDIYVTHDGASGRAAAYNRLLVEAGIDVHRLHGVDRSLEERFIDIVGNTELSTSPAPVGAPPPSGGAFGMAPPTTPTTGTTPEDPA